MRGRVDPQLSMMAVVGLEDRVPPDHPLRTIVVLADRALAELSPAFDRMCAEEGRPSIDPSASSLRRGARAGPERREVFTPL